MWSRILHPVVIVAGQLELERYLPMQYYTFTHYMLTKHKSKSAMMHLQAEWA